MNTIVGWRRRGLALLGGVAGLWLGAQPAAAQFACADLGDVPEDMLEFYLVEFDEDFAVDLGDEALCAVLTQTFVKACSTAVKDTAKCLQNAFSNLGRQRQAGCKGLLSGDDAKACSAQAKSLASGAVSRIKQEAGFLTEDCEGYVAEEYFEVCMFGF